MKPLPPFAARLARALPFADATILRFGAVGLLTTAIDVGLFSLIVGATDLPVAVINIATYGTGLCVSFLLNRHWTFKASKDDGSARRQAARYVAVYAVGAALSTIIVTLLATVLDERVAKLISVPIVFFWHYGAVRLFAFPSKPRV